MSEPPTMSLGRLNETAIEPMREAIRTIAGHCNLTRLS